MYSLRFLCNIFFYSLFCLSVPLSYRLYHSFYFMFNFPFFLEYSASAYILFPSPLNLFCLLFLLFSLPFVFTLLFYLNFILFNIRNLDYSRSYWVFAMQHFFFLSFSIVFHWIRRFLFFFFIYEVFCFSVFISLSHYYRSFFSLSFFILFFFFLLSNVLHIHLSGIFIFINSSLLYQFLSSFFSFVLAFF